MGTIAELDGTMDMYSGKEHGEMVLGSVDVIIDDTIGDESVAECDDIEVVVPAGCCSFGLK